MRPHSLQERADFYHEAFPKYPPLRADERWLDGMWVLGNYFKGSGYYGAYPPTFLKRIMSLFPDAEAVLHLFSGSLPGGLYVRCDIRTDIDTDVRGDAHALPFALGHFDLIVADPPYDKNAAKRYGTEMVNRSRVVKECAKVLRPGGYLVWLDNTLAMFRKDEFHLFGLIGVVRSTNHRFRVVSIFERR